MTLAPTRGLCDSARFRIGQSLQGGFCNVADHISLYSLRIMAKSALISQVSTQVGVLHTCSTFESGRSGGHARKLFVVSF